MAYRLIDTSIHTDPEMMDLSDEAFHLLLYFFTCPHTDQAGIVRIHPKTLSFESRVKNADKVVGQLDKYISCIGGNCYIIKKHIKHQAKGPDFLRAGMRIILNNLEVLPTWWDINKNIISERLTSKNGEMKEEDKTIITQIESEYKQAVELRNCLIDNELPSTPPAPPPMGCLLPSTVTVTEYYTEQEKEKYKKEKVQELAKSKKQIITEQAKEVLDYLNATVGRKLRPTDNTLKHIKARLNESFTVEECKQVIDNKMLDPYFQKNNYFYMRPETLFGEKFQSYLNFVPEVKETEQDWQKKIDEIKRKAREEEQRNDFE